MSKGKMSELATVEEGAEDEDEEMRTAFLGEQGMRRRPTGSTARKSDSAVRCPPSSSLTTRILSLLVGLTMIGSYLAYWHAVGDEVNKTESPRENTHHGHHHNHPRPPRQPLFRCPAHTSDSHQNPHEDEHRQDDLQILTNVSDYLHYFRNQPFDHWTPTYDEYKAAIYDWKSTFFADLPSSGTIYESASGLGLNLLLTLEILHEAFNRTDVTVYGNEYVDESVQLSRALWQSPAVLSNTGGAHYGQICRGDSSRLHEWIPPTASFDLVFCGYLTPLQDPLQLGLSPVELDDVYADVCKNTGDPVAVQQAQLLQERQENWFATWVDEMLRIAKPGAPVVVEMISFPTCQDLEEWGGVEPDFWKEAVDRYGWQVDPASIVVRDASPLPGRRYHVFMRKTR
jgi:hypothetical protein